MGLFYLTKLALARFIRMFLLNKLIKLNLCGCDTGSRQEYGQLLIGVLQRSFECMWRDMGN